MLSEDNAESLENAILDKLGKNDIHWEYLGEMNDPKINRITYEEVIDGKNDATSKPLRRKGVWISNGSRSILKGRYTLNMVKIDRQVREVISHIKMAEAQRSICKIK